MRTVLLVACALAIAACSSSDSMQTAVTTTPSSGGFFSNLWPFGGDSAADDATMPGTPQLGVNSYLWRATLDTLNFMPLASADPVGGIIISDWYAAPDKPDERVKVNVYILDKRLRADAL